MRKILKVQPVFSLFYFPITPNFSFLVKKLFSCFNYGVKIELQFLNVKELSS